MILILSLPQGFFSRKTDFHLHLFFSNFLKYSFSNFPLSQPYSNFAVYLPSSSICLSFFILVRRGSHRGGSPQNGLGYERTCGTTLASAYVLRRLSAAWSQLQMKERSPSGSECWMVCRRWTPEIEFNKRLSSSIIRLANYSVTTSLIYKLII